MASTGNRFLALKGIAALEVLTSLVQDPTVEQREILSRWPGWGPLAPAFDPEPDQWWGALNQKLVGLLDDGAYLAAAECVDNAFYTSAAVVDLVFGLLAKTGFDKHAPGGARILEPGCGSGRFMARTPAGWDVAWTGVESDPTSAAIARALHPDAEIIAAPLERVSLVDDSFDAAIGNVPFSSQTVYDRAAGYSSSSLHLYFLERALQAVHDGGYVIMVISRFAMDGYGLRHSLEAMGTLVGAIRLPSGVFRQEGTDVVVDVICVRKGDAPAGWVPKPLAEPKGITWYGTSYYGSTGDKAKSSEVSPYWDAHPLHVAGTIVPSGNFHNPIEVKPGPDPTADIARAAAALAADIAKAPYIPRNEPGPEHVIVPTDGLGHQEGTFVLGADGTMSRVKEGELVEVPRPSKELRLLVELRDAGARLLELEADTSLPDEALEAPRARALSLYRSYLAQFGPLNRGTLHEGKVDQDTGLPTLSWRRPTMGGFRGDPGFIGVLALEHYDMETGEAEPAAILLGRVNRRPEPIERVDTPGEALSVCLGETARLDLSRIASLLGLPEDEAAAEALGDLVYQDPEAGGVHKAARDYLSGNVRKKLAAARAAAAKDERYERNVSALEAVMPTELGPFEIDVHLGVPWVIPDDVEDFLEEVVGRRPNVSKVDVTASWHVEAWGIPPAATTTWGTSRLNAYQLCEMALNGRTPVVYDEVLTGPPSYARKKVRNPEQTLAAAEKMAALDDRFGTWVWEDRERSARICAEYNERFSSYVVRKATGAHLTFPTLAKGTDLWPWQRNIIDRLVSSPTGFCAHEVGLGKTLSEVGTAVTLRRLGLATKPMLVVPNHLLEQIAREAQQAFPLGRFLVAGKDDLAGDARRLFAARCATGDWDAVIMTHQGFTSIPTDPGVEERWILEQKAAYGACLRSGDGDHTGAKEIARALRSLETRLRQLRDDANDEHTVLFEHLGVDWVGIDEVSLSFRRLPIAGRATGFSFGSSKRATDLLMKAMWLRRRRRGMPYLAFFSGTPWSNTLAETFVWQTYLQPERLEEVGLSVFDAWAAAFVKRETRVEVAPDGSGFRTATRPVGLRNLPELRTMLGEVMDILPADQVTVERPAAVVENVVVDPTDEQRAYVKSLVRRADRIRLGSVSRETDNMLLICTDGRKVALDPRLVGIDGAAVKLDAVAERVAAIYHDAKDTVYGDGPVPGALQLVFCDMGTPGEKGAQSYGRLKERLVAHGVPLDKVRWIHEAQTDKAKAALFTACRSGAVAVLLASTDKAGLGTNVQTRLVAVHHADAPHRPSDMAQRDGRAIRPGNLNDKVHILRYVTQSTFDAYMWQALERKARSFNHMFSADPAVREIDDLGEVVLSYGEVKALASGNPLLLRQAEVQAQVKRLRTMKAVDSQSVAAALRHAETLKKQAEVLSGRIKALGPLLESAGRWTPDALHEVSTKLGESGHEAARKKGSWWGATARHYETGTRFWLKREDRSFTLAFWRDYETVAEETIRVGPMLHSKKEAIGTVASVIDRFWHELPQRVSDYRSTVAKYRATIAEANRLAESYVFDHEVELDAALQRLGVINAEITAAAEEPAPTEQAA